MSKKNHQDFGPNTTITLSHHLYKFDNELQTPIKMKTQSSSNTPTPAKTTNLPNGQKKFIPRTSTSSSDFIMSYATKIATRKARELERGVLFHRDERDDIVQELVLDAWIRFQKSYNPRKGASKTFISLTIKHCAIQIVRKRLKELSNFGHILSFDDVIAHKNGIDITVEDCLSIDDYTSRIKEATKTHDQLIDLAIDAKHTIKTLSKPMQALCNMLMNDHSITEIAALMNIKRTTLHDNIKALRKAFSGILP